MSSGPDLVRIGSVLRPAPQGGARLSLSVDRGGSHRPVTSPVTAPCYPISVPGGSRCRGYASQSWVRPNAALSSHPKCAWWGFSRLWSAACHCTSRIRLPFRGRGVESVRTSYSARRFGSRVQANVVHPTSGTLGQEREALPRPEPLSAGCLVYGCDAAKRVVIMMWFTHGQVGRV